MTTKKQREIVIEFERIKLIRKRAKSRLAHCGGCGGNADLVKIMVVAGLFDVSNKDLAEFVDANAIHRGSDSEICINSLLQAMQEKNARKGIRLIGTDEINEPTAFEQRPGSSSG